MGQLCTDSCLRNIIPDLEVRPGETGIPANRELPQSVNMR